ncbi:hypothetical protein E4P39_06155 [Blastococcus sp. CT_GayMR19]|uniref:hypothetical protein n=1 Tax=Blastococcus sp. CT_GayMR19 TaxID=2559608 RepID=UPI0010736D51|nr:hypothetical protein [Blastococcus sp. CT_GayMR19]TFV77551.1 hypothetical protein E4P39_06155 [Blastococcus sp. CT_GayMR19]
MTSLLALLILAGLPLLLWQLGRQGYWTRLRTRVDADPAAELLRRHDLAAREAAAVTTAVERGRELEDPALRRAAVDLARLSLARSQPRGSGTSWGSRVVVLLAAVWGTLVVADAGFALAFGRFADVNWFTLVGAALVFSSPIRRGIRLHRAIALNADRPAGRE